MMVTVAEGPAVVLISVGCTAKLTPKSSWFSMTASLFMLKSVQTVLAVAGKVIVLVAGTKSASAVREGE